MYLLDTNVISELRRQKPHGSVVEWLRSVEDAHLHIASMTVAEIQAGIELTRVQDVQRAQEIEKWLDMVAATMSVLPLDTAVMRTWARMMHGTSDLVWEDAMIAAVAKVHGLTVATRNTRDFKAFGVPLLDPFTVALR
jgi:toxin FitB